MKATVITVLLVAGALSGCMPETPTTDQCLRQEIFKQCMISVPKGPTHLTAAGNDWDEVVSACGTAAYYQSIRAKAAIAPQCRSN